MESLFLAMLCRAEGHVTLPCGRVSVAWTKREDGKHDFEVEMPKKGVLRFRGREIGLSEGRNSLTL